MRRTLPALGVTGLLITGSLATSANITTASASTATAITVIAKPVSVRAGRLESMQFAVPRNTYCLVSARHNTLLTHTHAVKATRRVFSYVWTVPATTRRGTWGLTVACGKTAASAYRGGIGRRTVYVTIRSGRTYGGVAPVRTTLLPKQLPLSSEAAVSGLGAVGKPFGALLLAGSAWLGGAGVNVYSNGGGGYSGISSGYGIKWQCVELVERLIMTKGWSPAIPVAYAYQLYGKASSSAFIKHPAGDGYLPVPGDIIVWRGGTYGYGHTAVVSADTGGTLSWVEQNGWPNGMQSEHISSTGAVAAYPYTPSLTVIGYLHAWANRIATAQPAPTPTPASGHNPDGNLDGASRSGSTLHVVGWAHDADADSAGVTVRALVDGKDVGEALANVSRTDVGTHGFDFTTPLDANAHHVCAQAVNIGGGTDTILPGCVDVPAASAQTVDRYGVTSYDRMQPSAPYHGSGFVYAYQAFTAQSNTLTYAGVTVGTPNYPDSTGLKVDIKICTTQQCTSGVLASVNAAIANYGNSWADLGDIAVTPGATYYIYWTEPQAWNGQRWAIYWWSGGSTFAASDQMQAVVKGYNR
jgi:hypothetical protein